MEKQDLQFLVDASMTQRKIAASLHCSQSNVKYWLKKFGLKTITRKQHGQAKCNFCGATEPTLFFIQKNGIARSRCKRCDTKDSIRRFRAYKQAAIDYKGGGCYYCGYNKCPGALDFHHLNPNEKDPQWRNNKNRPLDSIKSELDKCILVCKNCHAEIHFNHDFNSTPPCI